MADQSIDLKDVTEQTGQFIQNAGQKTTASVIHQTEKYSDAYVAMHKIIDGFWERVPYIIIGLIVFLLFWLLAKLFKIFVKKALLNRSYTRQNLVLVLNRVGSTFILFLGFLIALVVIIPGFSPGQLISALGIGSVAIGFAFKDIFQNLLSGILILLGEPFRIGDDIVVNGMEGTVEDIQIRATFLRSPDGRRLVIPNATVYTSAITVNTAYQRRRCNFNVGIGYDDDIETAKGIIQHILETNSDVLAQPAFSINVASLGDFSVNINISWWVDVKATSISTSLSHIQSEVKQAFAREGISIPYPTQDLRMIQEDKASQTTSN